MKIQEWARKAWILPGLLHGEKAYHGPYYVNVDATHRCNMKCLCCRWHSPLVTKPLLDPEAPVEIDAELFEGFCRDLGRMGSHVVLFVGAGEPALHTQFLRLLESTRRHKLKATVYTNGTLFTNYSSADLIDSGLDLIRFSLSEVSPDSYALRHPYLRPETFEKNWDAVRQLSAARKNRHRRCPRLELCIPMDRDNMLHIDPMVDLAVSAGMDRVHFSVVLDFDQEGLKQYTLTPQEIEVVREQLEKIRPRLVRLKLDNNIDDVLLRYRVGRSVRKSIPCYSGWFYSFLDTSGQVKVCQRATGALGDLRKQSFAQIWNGPIYRAFRRQSLHQHFSEGGDRRFDCSFCPHLANNHRVDRVFRLIEPLARRDKSTHP